MNKKATVEIESDGNFCAHIFADAAHVERNHWERAIPFTGMD